MQENKSAPIGSPVGQNEPIVVQKQLASSHWPSNTIQRNKRRQDQYTQCGPEEGRWFLAWLIRPWRWRPHVPPKRRLTFSGLDDVIAQKTELVICILLWRTHTFTCDFVVVAVLYSLLLLAFIYCCINVDYCHKDKHITVYCTETLIILNLV
jgi:hypothetical protein